MRKVLALAERVARVETPILLTGESGSGKEHLARFIHSRSPRAEGPFIPINCGALPEPLLESELFGHVKGAFTGAVAEHPGLFEAAAGGMLLLDEIAETTPALQVKLLRVLQDHQVRRVGSVATRPVDVRVIAATNRNLEEMVAAKSFRKDLYYRLNVVRIEMPPLRERREDILDLALRFVRRDCERFHCGPCTFSRDVVERLLTHPWPGNVRELEHAIERSVVLAEGKPRIELTDLPPEVLGGSGVAPEEDDLLLSLEALERRHILRVLEHCGGNRKATARVLGIAENTLWRKLRAYGLVNPRRRE